MIGSRETAPPIAGGTLFLVAHQDDAGVHLHDRSVAPAEVYARLRRASAGDPPYATVDLSVCGADRPGNLAVVFQALGASVILTRGSVGYDGGMFQRLLRLLNLIQSGSRLSLPESSRPWPTPTNSSVRSVRKACWRACAVASWRSRDSTLRSRAPAPAREIAHPRS